MSRGRGSARENVVVVGRVRRRRAAFTGNAYDVLTRLGVDETSENDDEVEESGDDGEG